MLALVARNADTPENLRKLIATSNQERAEEPKCDNDAVADSIRFHR